MTIPNFCFNKSFSSIISLARMADARTPPPFTHGNTTTPGKTPETYTLIALTIPSASPEHDAIFRNPFLGKEKFLFGIQKKAEIIPTKVETIINPLC